MKPACLPGDGGYVDVVSPSLALDAATPLPLFLRPSPAPDWRRYEAAAAAPADEAAASPADEAAAAPADEAAASSVDKEKAVEKKADAVDVLPAEKPLASAVVEGS